MAFPFTFSNSGWILATITLILVGLLVYYNFILLFSISENCQEKLTYAEMTELYYGKIGLYIVRIFIIIFQIGTCIAYVIFFLKFFNHAF